MPSLNFMEKFSEDVLQGRKKQTIRRTRKKPISEGDRLYLFTDMMTKRCTRLRNTSCDRAQYIFIDNNKTVLLGDHLLTDPEKRQLAIDDGFNDFDEMFDFFHEQFGLPFEGQLIKWL